MASPGKTSLLALLKEHFGFDAFRPLQREIIEDVLAGRDVFALLPTGGGKSLCFQLPALAQDGLTLVVSPLIALMKDQVDSMTASGIPATFLNSSISAAEAGERMSGLSFGKYKLLYVAPERLMQPRFLEFLPGWNPRLIAIDEAHCISEWGHDFRPEYRQLSQLRAQFPELPVLALTATATTRVRADIVRQLSLRNPGIYVASFNRPNLTYAVREKRKPVEQILAFIREHPDESGIVYCQSRNGTESIAQELREQKISARAYHAGMEPTERAKVQESFQRDDTQVICATIAFGMGINKPNVRFVIHHDLPKNIEGYYQETGRAGRDSLPSECLLLYSAGDVAKLFRFLDDKPEPEKTVAREQITSMMHFAESSECRRRALLRYFDEKFESENCGGCDNCLNPKVQVDGTVAAQKFLSCVYRVQEKSRFTMGLAHYAEILRGSASEKILKHGHQSLSTYGIGKEYPTSTWTAVGRELLRLGYLRQDSEQYSTVGLTPEGKAVLVQRKAVMLSTRPEAGKEKRRAKETRDGDFDGALFEQLRAWRKSLADERNVAAFHILTDVTLRQIAREYPTHREALGRIAGLGRKKIEEFADPITLHVNAFLASNPRRQFATETPEIARPKLTPTILETLRAYRSGKTVETIARERQVNETTIIAHLCDAVAAGETVRISDFISEEKCREIAHGFEELGDGALSLVKEHFADRYTYTELHLARAWYRLNRATSRIGK